MNPQVDAFLVSGCGRCNLYDTPQCKAVQWSTELAHLRAVVLDCGLTEELKWSQPCYTFRNKNVLLVSAFKDSAFISFLKGSLLQDAAQKLVFAGPNSQVGKQWHFTTVADIEANKATIKAYIHEAIEIEKAGLKVPVKKELDPLPEELEQRLAAEPELHAAFEALTPGRKRSYIIHVGGAKQAQTRANRVEKCIPKIMAGKGFNEY